MIKIKIKTRTLSKYSPNTYSIRLPIEWINDLTIQEGEKMMRKTTIELTEEQYFYLQEKVLELKRKRQSVSMGSLIRDLIERDMQVSTGKRKTGK